MTPELRSHYNLGRATFQSGDYAAAEPMLREVNHAHPEFADVHNMLGVIAMEAGRMSEAEEHLNTALRLNPHYTEAALHLSICYNEMGRYGDAREVYGMATSDSPGGRRAGLERHSRMVKARIANLHAELGDSYAAVGEADLASSEYMAALEICPNFGDIRLKLAAVLRDAGRIDGAIAELLTLRREAPDFLRARLQLGLTYWVAKRYTDAKREWQAVLEKQPDNRVARFYFDRVDEVLARKREQRPAATW